MQLDDGIISRPVNSFTQFLAIRQICLNNSFYFFWLRRLSVIWDNKSSNGTWEAAAEREWWMLHENWKWKWKCGKLWSCRMADRIEGTATLAFPDCLRSMTGCLFFKLMSWWKPQFKCALLNEFLRWWVFSVSEQPRLSPFPLERSVYHSFVRRLPLMLLLLILSELRIIQHEYHAPIHLHFFFHIFFSEFSSFMVLESLFEYKFKKWKNK